MEASQISFETLERALVSLEQALLLPPANDLERDGVIHRFEFTFELCWKMIRRWLLAQGRIDVSASPKPLFRDALQEGLIQDLPKWFKFLEARNEVSHIYEEEIARRVFEVTTTFPGFARLLLEKLQQ